jgi:leucyl aminopeptidase
MSISINFLTMKEQKRRALRKPCKLFRRFDFMFIDFIATPHSDTKTLVIFTPEEAKLTQHHTGLSAADVAHIEKTLKITEFKGKKGEAQVVTTVGHYDRVVVIGFGKTEKLEALVLAEVGGAVYKTLAALNVTSASVIIDSLEGNANTNAETAGRIAYGAKLRSYRFDKYKTKEKEDSKKPKLEKLHFVVKEAPSARHYFEAKDALAEAVFFTRNLQNEPANVIYPASLAKAAKEALVPLGVNVKILGEAEMKKLGMNALLGVGQGSANESQLVVMEYTGKGGSDAPLGLVGKGVTFDTGGISIKPSANMEDMKWDMGGAAVVIGTILALAKRRAKVDVVGVVGLVENMPSGTAQRPGDIVTSMSGQTIEVLNTDAEGRLVLADALWYCQKNHKPKAIVDLATLTGAIVVALGESTAGLFSNDDAMASQIEKASKTVGEPVWRLPMNETYDKDIDCDFADMKNIGSGRGGGSITAAQFLQRFIENGLPWVHLDIAGVTWAKKDSALVPKGATAFGLRLLEQFIRENYEG